MQCIVTFSAFNFVITRNSFQGSSDVQCNDLSDISTLSISRYLCQGFFYQCNCFTGLQYQPLCGVLKFSLPEGSSDRPIRVPKAKAANPNQV